MAWSFYANKKKVFFLVRFVQLLFIVKNFFLESLVMWDWFKIRSVVVNRILEFECLICWNCYLLLSSFVIFSLTTGIFANEMGFFFFRMKIFKLKDCFIEIEIYLNVVPLVMLVFWLKKNFFQILWHSALENKFLFFFSLYCFLVLP